MPVSMLHIALIEPEIPPNTGNIARLCAATNVTLHLVGRLGFRVDDKAVKRAGLDYWHQVTIEYHRSVDALRLALPDSRMICVETGVARRYTDFEYYAGDCLVFGRETKGLPPELLAENPDHCVYIPIANPAIRSLNLANAVAIVLFEALRQIDSRQVDKY